MSQAPSQYEEAPTSARVDASTSNTSNGFHATETASKTEHAGDMMKQVMQVQSDAPPCSDCGSMMIRAGACYKCPDCGTTSGCG